MAVIVAEQQELVKVESMPSNTVVHTKFEIYELWDKGILNTLAFVYMALEFDKERIDKTGKLDLDYFANHWDLGGKQLTEDQLLKALATLQKKERISLGDRQLSLELL